MGISDSSLYLLIAIPFGVLGTISMKLSNGLRKLRPTISLAIFYLISFVALTMSISGTEVSIVYALWSGAGTILVCLLGILIFDESVSKRKLISLLLIVLGIIGIYLPNVI